MAKKPKKTKRGKPAKNAKPVKRAKAAKKWKASFMALAGESMREFRAVCAQGDFKGQWTGDQETAQAEGLAHQNDPGNETHVITVLVRQAGGG